MAKFNDDGKGERLPLVFGQNGLDASKGFENRGDLLIKTVWRQTPWGATKMDRPGGLRSIHITPAAFTARSPTTAIAVRKESASGCGQPARQNVYGHIIHWLEHNGDPTALQFARDILVMGGRTDTDKPETKGSMKGRNSAAPMA